MRFEQIEKLAADRVDGLDAWQLVDVRGLVRLAYADEAGKLANLPLHASASSSLIVRVVA